MFAFIFTLIGAFSMFGTPVQETYEETLHQDWWQGFTMTEVHFRDKTDVQDLIIFENPIYGRVMALDGAIQVTEGDEFTYHEMLTHVPLFAHGNAKKVLIIGGGDGGILREVLRHPEVVEVVMVEIDRYVVDLAKKYMPSIPKDAFEDPRTKLVIADGALFVQECQEKFDVIISDSTDPMGPGEVLFTEEFYGDCQKLLTKDGILVNQHSVPFLQRKELKNAYERRIPHFKHVTFYTVAVPTYIGGMMTLGWATNSDRYQDLTEETLRERTKCVSGGFKYYTPAVHQAAFALPAYIADSLAR